MQESQQMYSMVCEKVKARSWFDKLEYNKDEGAVFFASGVFYYFEREDVKKLLSAMAERFPGGKIVFDATNASGLKSMAKTWLSWSDMEQVGICFSVEHEQELKTWSGKFKEVVHKGYMTGYRPLDKRYGWKILFLNWLIRQGDVR